MVYSGGYAGAQKYQEEEDWDSQTGVASTNYTSSSQSYGNSSTTTQNGDFGKSGSSSYNNSRYNSQDNSGSTARAAFSSERTSDFGKSNFNSGYNNTCTDAQDNSDSTTRNAFSSSRGNDCREGWHNTRTSGSGRSLTMNIPGECLRAVCSQRGAIIREIQQNTNTLIGIDKENGTADIFGNLEGIYKAKHKLHQIIAKEKGRVKWRQHDDRGSSNRHGNNDNVNIRWPSAQSNSHTSEYDNGGDEWQQSNRRSDLVITNSRGHQYENNRRENDGSDRQGDTGENWRDHDGTTLNGGDNANNGYSPSKYSSGHLHHSWGDTGMMTEVIKVEPRLAGRIVGVHGEKITEIRQQSGAKVAVPRVRKSDPSALIVVKIYGTVDQRKTAREMIEECFVDFQRGGYQQRNDGYNQRNDGYQQRNDGSQQRNDGYQQRNDGYQKRNDGYQQRSNGSQQRNDRYQQQNDGSQHRNDGFGSLGNNWSSTDNKSEGFGSSGGNFNSQSSYRSEPKVEPNSAVKNSADSLQPEHVIDWKALNAECEKYRQQKWLSYGAIKKNFYIEDTRVANLTEQQVSIIRAEHDTITVDYPHGPAEGQTIPNPVRMFEEAFAHYPEILTELKRAGFKQPSPIQMQGWPVALSGQDLIGIAQTGTGKTLSFILPAFIHIEGQLKPREERGGPTVLVLSPTRELALQIEEEIKKYTYRGIKCVCIYGGGSRREQINLVTKGVEIIVATPGRLNDLIVNNIVDVKTVTYLVLDEADRMLDLGFEPAIRKILIDIRPDRQTIMTSATWPNDVRRIAQSFMTNPVQVCIGSLDLTAMHSVRQLVLVVDENDKKDMLEDIIANMAPDDKLIVFMSRKNTVDYIASNFAIRDILVQSIHGGREQYDREQAIEDLKTGAVKVLLATDVASRGLDIKDITHVLNYDFPNNIEEYVHRVGRTGRAGRTGESITFMTKSDWRQAADLIKIMEEAEQEVPQEVYDMASRCKKKQAEGGFLRGGRGGRGGGGRGGGRGRRDDGFSGSFF